MALLQPVQPGLQHLCDLLVRQFSLADRQQQVGLGTGVGDRVMHQQLFRLTGHAEALQVVRAADVKNVDETSWKLAGKLCWLWVAATGTVAAFLIHARRGWQALAALLGEKS